MKTLYKTLTIAFLTVFIFNSGLNVDFVGAQNTAEGAASARLPADLLLSKYLRFSRFTAEDGFSNDQIRAIAQDNQGFMWFGTADGLNRYDGAGVKIYRHNPDDPSSLGHNYTRALFADQSGVLWIGTWGGGLNQYDREKDAFIRYQHDPDDPHSLSSNIVKTVYEDRAGTIWVGTISGLNKLDREKKQFTRYQHDPDDPNSLSNKNVGAVVEDSSGVLWVGTNDGLNRFDPKTGPIIRYRHNPDDPSSLSHNSVRSIYEDRSSILWVGTDNGLCKFNPETIRFTHYQHVATDPHSLANDTVASMYEDRTGTLWIGTTKGLHRFDRQNDQFTHYTSKNGLPSDTIYGILEDEQGRLWLSTANGLSRFDPRTESFRNYSESDGLQSDTFLNFSAYSKSQSGEMFFGGSNGFNAFYPDQIVDNLTPPPVLITDFQLAYKPVPIGGDSVLQKSILETDELVLSYRDQVYSFEFAVLNYRAPQQNRYKFRMEGFEKDWNETDVTRRVATYTHLDPGDYVFRVIGANNDGIWNEEGASIRITPSPHLRVSPPSSLWSSP